MHQIVLGRVCKALAQALGRGGRVCPLLQSGGKGAHHDAVLDRIGEGSWPCPTPEQELSVQVGHINRVHIDDVDVHKACETASGAVGQHAQQARSREMLI
eukprot:363543-Chlamydomonas_euryale.AAC.1